MAENGYRLMVGYNVATGRDGMSGGGRGRPNIEKYEGRRRKRDHSIATILTVPELSLRR